MDHRHKCPSCNGDLLPEDAYCSHCGTRIQTRGPAAGAARRTLVQETVATADRLNCGSCNSPLLPGDLFCSACGARFGAAVTDPDVAERSRQANLGKLEEATRGRFEFLRELGRGGMGTVYLARELDLDRLVAIKVLASGWLTDDAMVERFRREAKVIASLRHPSVVHVHGVGRAEDLHYFIMDYIDGVSLSAMLRTHGALPIPVIRTILYQVGSALSYAQRPGRGVIHRDVKPGNIMVDHEGNSFVTDFGISKVTESRSGLTLTGLIMGTPEYMSPEQCRGDAATGAADQYALGSVAYAMLTGSPPFTGPHYRVLMGHTTETPRPIRELRRDCPAGMAKVIERMLAKLANERWPDITDALRAMDLRPLMADDPVREEIAELVRSTVGSRARAPGRGGRRGEADTGGRPTWLRILEAPDSLETGERIPIRVRLGFSDGHESDDADVEWESTDPSIARIDPDTGQLVAAGTGSAVLTARALGIAESIEVQVVPPRVTQLAVEPDRVEVEVGDTERLVAEAKGRHGTVLERPVLWSSSDPGTATISEAGVVRGHREGSASILAHCEGVGATATAVVVPARVASVKIVNLPGAVTAGTSSVLRADARDARGRSLDRILTWRASNVDVASIDATGRLDAHEPGDVLVTVECEGHAATAAITILPPPIAKVRILRPEAPVVTGGTVRLDALLLDVRDRPANRDIFWKSADRSILTIDEAGNATGIAPGTVEVMATCEGVLDRITVEVLPPPVAFVELGDPPSELVDGDTFHLMAIPRDAMGGVLQRPLAWRVEAGDAVEDLGEGQFRARSSGTAVVAVRSEDAESRLELTVDPVRVASVRITGVPERLQVDERAQLSVVLQDQRGRPIERPVDWTSNQAFIARVNPTGLVEGAGPGAATITAECEGIRDAVQITVEPASWVTVVIPKPDVDATLAGRETATGETPAAAPAGPDATGVPAGVAPESGPEPAEPGEGYIAWASRSEPASRRNWLWAVPAVVLVGAGAAWFALGRGPAGGPPAMPADSVTVPAATPPLGAAIADSSSDRPSGGEQGASAGDSGAASVAGRAASPGTRTTTAPVTPPPAARREPPPVTPPPARTDTTPTRRDTTPPEREAVTPPATPPPEGTLRLIVQPWANVFVDGEERGTQRQRLELSLPPGSHTLRLENPNTMPVDTTFVITSGTPTLLRIQMPPRDR